MVCEDHAFFCRLKIVISLSSLRFRSVRRTSFNVEPLVVTSSNVTPILFSLGAKILLSEQNAKFMEYFCSKLQKVPCLDYRTL